MANGHPHLAKQPRSSNWYFRRRVPLDLVEAIGKRDIWKSLGTPCKKEALRKIAEVSAEVEKRLANARRRKDAQDVAAVSETELIRIAQEVFRAELARYDSRIVADPDGVAVAVDEELEPLREALEEGAWDDALAAFATDVLEAHGYRMERDSPHFVHALTLITRARAAANRTTAKRAEGDFGFVFRDPLVTVPLKAPSGPLSRSTASPDVAPGSLTLGQLIDRYMSDPARSGVSAKTRVGYQTIFKLLREVIGENKPAATITRDECRQVRDLLVSLPPNFTKRWRDKGAAEVAEIAKREKLPTMSAGTVNSYMTNLSALFNWATTEEYVDRNPATKLQVAVETKKKDRRKPFSSKQLKAIFNAPLYTGCKDDESGYDTPGPNKPRRARFWVPLLALFAGMRLNECCQLDVTDIKKLDGVWCILIREDSEHGADDKRVKTDAGERFVPVHPELIKLGFLEHVQAMRKEGQRKVFPELPAGANGYYSDPFGKWFARFLEKAGAKAERTSFHSFRHNYRDALREAGIPPERVRALGGWVGGGDAEEIYGGGFKANTLASEIRKISYPGLNLRHLNKPECT